MFWLLLACATSSESPTPGVITPIGDGEDTGPTVPDDPSGDDTASPPDTGESDPPDPVEEAPRIWINEAMSSNTCSFAVAGTMPDWVELYNDSAETVGLDEITLWDSTGAMWIGPAGESIAPGGYYVVLADGGSTGAHAPFKLSSEGDTLSLAVRGQVTDRLGTGLLSDDVAWGRFPDGGDWDITSGGTPGVTNGMAPAEYVDPTANVYSLNALKQVSITLSDSAVASLASVPSSYVEGGVSIDGALFDPVGVRLRGSMTFQPLTGKPAFKVDLNRYDGADYCGEIKKVNLLNMYYDASMVREYMAYYVNRQLGVIAPRNAYAQVSVNDAYIGVELLSEAYDDVLLDEWFGYDNQDGYMIWEEAGLECETGECDNDLVQAYLSILNDPATDENVALLEQHLDLDESLREIAAELTLGQWDGFCAPHNFRYAYNPVTGLISILPSSLDLTFGNLGYTYGGDFFQCNGSSLLSWCLSNNSCEQRYIDILQEEAEGIEGGGDSDMQIDAVMEQARLLMEPVVADETRGQYTEEQWVEQFTAVRSYLHGLPDQIRAQIDAR